MSFWFNLIHIYSFKVVIDIPSGVQRLSILEAHTRSLNLHDDVSLAYLAEVTLGYVGADLASLCREAAFMALKRYFTQTCKDTSGTFSTKPEFEGTVEPCLMCTPLIPSPCYYA